MNCSVKTKAKLVLGYMISWSVFSVSILIIIFMIASGLLTGGYSSAWNSFLQKQTYQDALTALYGYCWDYFSSTIEEGTEYELYYYNELYSVENSNFRFTCVSESEYVIPGYYYTDEKRQYTDSFQFVLTHYGDSFYNSYYFESMSKVQSFLETLEEGVDYNISYDEEGYSVTVSRENRYTIDLEMKVYVPQKLTADDKYYLASIGFSVLDTCKVFIFAAAAVSAVFTAVFGVKLINRAGRKNDDETIYLKPADRIPYEIFCFASFAAAVLLAAWVSEWLGRDPQYLLSFIGHGIFGFCGLVVIGLVLLEFVLSTAVRLKKGTLFSNTVCYKVFSGISNGGRKIKEAVKNVYAYKKVAGVFLGFDAVLCLFAWARGFYSGEVVLLLLFAAVMFAFVLFQVCVVYNIYLLQTACDRLASGDFDYKIENKYILKYFHGMAESINNIRNGMNQALQDSIKSEHFKTELITNVSHDIKTPLTSIISYVNLLQKSKVSGKEAAEYLEVLERQSGKLKKLIEDLVEASKASTGNLNLEYSVMDIAILIEQAVGEYEEKFADRNLSVIFEKQSEGNFVNADGRYLWRVIDNLLSNICKYSLENTRVYITVQKNIENRCVIIFKNISKYEIKITPEELTERFVRGDKSRNTEGSGLGLSIVRSLTEAMGGRFYIEIDGDLYKAFLVFDVVEETAPDEEIQ